MKKDDDLQKKIKDLKEKENKKKKMASKKLKELELLQKENEELKNQLLRASAEMQNFRRRTEEEKGGVIEFVTGQIITEILPVIDNFDRSFDHLPENLQDEEWTKGIAHILDQCHELLGKYNVTEMQVKPGDSLDPKLHEVMMPGEGSPGEIIEILRKGYLIDDRVLRTAKVRAAV